MHLARRLTISLSALIGLWLSAWVPAAAETTQHRADDHAFKLVTLAEGLSHPWSLAFLPDGAMLVTERGGTLWLLRDGEPQRVAGVPEIAAVGQGGLLDLALHPDFAANRWLYMTYAVRQGRGYATQLARGRLNGTRLEELQVLLESDSVTTTSRHFGSRLQFDADGLLYMTIGDRGDADLAQDLGNHIGTVLRLTETGGVPADNPFVGPDSPHPEIYSYGHRNPQGLTRHPETGAIWSVEHGPRGGDELNLIAPGINYGWPVITYGRAYSGLPIGEGTHKDGMAQPVAHWVPSISPSGMAFYSGSEFPAWHGSLFVGALSGELLARLEIESDRLVGEERLLQDLGERIRDVRMGPDGRLYLLTDSGDGRLLRIEPAD